jgi:hypothetical protein
VQAHAAFGVRRAGRLRAATRDAAVDLTSESRAAHGPGGGVAARLALLTAYGGACAALTAETRAAVLCGAAGGPVDAAAALADSGARRRPCNEAAQVRTTVAVRFAGLALDIAARGSAHQVLAPHGAAIGRIIATGAVGATPGHTHFALAFHARAAGRVHFALNAARRARALLARGKLRADARKGATITVFRALCSRVTTIRARLPPVGPAARAAREKAHADQHERANGLAYHWYPTRAASSNAPSI